MQVAYFSSEVAKSLEIGASTLRKYALALEEHGYRFDRGINNSRVFYQKDILVIQRLISAITKQNMSLEQAIKLAVELNSENEVSTPATIEEQPKAPIEQLCQRIEQLEINQSKLVEVNIQLSTQLEEQHTWLREKMEGLEHDRALLEGIRSSQEEKANQQTSSFKSLFSFFSKKKGEA
jgi:DNA-binding transcriptional MerR regulator